MCCSPCLSMLNYSQRFWCCSSIEFTLFIGRFVSAHLLFREALGGVFVTSRLDFLSVSYVSVKIPPTHFGIFCLYLVHLCCRTPRLLCLGSPKMGSMMIVLSKPPSIFGLQLEDEPNMDEPLLCLLVVCLGGSQM